MSLALIMMWYTLLGGLAATGSMYLSRHYVPVRHEATCYGLALIVIAGFYLACTAYFGNPAAWGLELGAVLTFAALALLGTRLPFVLIVGYVLHGGWDLLHEVQAQTTVNLFGGWDATMIPLAYGAFCAAFDWIIGGYLWHRRRAWRAA